MVYAIPVSPARCQSSLGLSPRRMSAAAVLAGAASSCFDRVMAYKIEMKYFYGWDVAGWIDESDAGSEPTRFFSTKEARAALDEFLTEVKAAVLTGNMGVEANAHDFRIVVVSR